MLTVKERLFCKRLTLSKLGCCKKKTKKNTQHTQKKKKCDNAKIIVHGESLRRTPSVINLKLKSQHIYQ